MQEEKQPDKEKKIMSPFRRIILEAGFIIFLFYSNLLMGEYSRSGAGSTHGLLWAMHDVFTVQNLCIAIATALIGHLIFDYILKRGR